MNNGVEDYIASIFCEDALFDFSGHQVKTVSAIQGMMQALEKYSSTQHQVFNTLYEVQGDCAEGETYCRASHLLKEFGETKKIDMGITYRDQLRRTVEGWRIAQRIFILHWSSASPVDPGAGPEDRSPAAIADPVQ